MTGFHELLRLAKKIKEEMVKDMSNNEEPQERQKWYTQLKINQSDEIFFAPTLKELKQRVLDHLRKASPTRLITLEGGQPIERTYKRIGEGAWDPSLLAQSDDEFFEGITDRMFIGPGPEHTDWRGEERQERLIVEGEIHLEHVRTVTEQTRPNVVNTMIKRGWVILSIENNRDRGIVYVLGHEELDAF
jgi:hypothetical protein